jgi:hypothetical protein
MSTVPRCKPVFKATFQTGIDKAVEPPLEYLVAFAGRVGPSPRMVLSRRESASSCIC